MNDLKPGSGSGGSSGAAGSGTAGGSGAAGAMGTAGTSGTSGASGTSGSLPCSDLFAPTLQTFSIDISASDWAAIQQEFITAGMLTDNAFANYQPVLYPVVFHYGSETVSDAFIHLRGDSSWREAVQFDGTNGKMQFGIEFDHTVSSASFHGIGKLKLDMPRTDPTFLRDRIANNWLRSVGVFGVCATSGQLMVNGSLYGVYVAEDHGSSRLLKQFFPGNSDGDLFDGGWIPVTNQLNPNTSKLAMFWAAMTPATMSAIVDVPSSFTSWAAEAVLNDGDGYWGGDHNFYLYDQGPKGYVFLPKDLDSSLDYLGRFDSDPITWWSVRGNWPLPIPQHYLIMVGDAGLRAQFVEALRTMLGRYDATLLQGWIDAWAPQVQAAVAADPHKPAETDMQAFQEAVSLARRGFTERRDYLKRWLDCHDSGTGADQDGDGYIWCNDCSDDNAAVHPGAAEICGNGFDDNCNGVVDDGCQ